MTSRFQNFSILKLLFFLDGIELGIEKSVGFGIEKNSIKKGIRFGFVQILGIVTH